MSRRWRLVPRARPNLGGRQLAAALTVDEGQRRDRDHVVDRLSAWTGHDTVSLAASGRGALWALLATSKRRRAVIPAFTCNAVADAAELAGLRVEIVDVSDGYNWAPQDLVDLGPDDVVVATHQYGIPARIDQIAARVKAAGSLLIEDCAGGLGGRYRGRPLGSFGDAAFFSFDMSKLIHVPPKGGALTVAEPEWGSRAREWISASTAPITSHSKAAHLARAAFLAACGPAVYRGLHTAVLSSRGLATTENGDPTLRPDAFYLARPAEWQARIAAPQLDRIGPLAEAARRLYERYLEGLAGCESLKLPPHDAAWEWAPIRFPVLVHGDKLDYYRRLLDHGVDCAFSFTHLAAHPLPSRAQEIADSVLCLPFYPGLAAGDAERVIEAVHAVDGAWQGVSMCKEALRR